MQNICWHMLKKASAFNAISDFSDIIWNNAALCSLFSRLYILLVRPFLVTKLI